MNDAGFRAIVIVISDRGARGERPDQTAPRLEVALRDAGIVLSETRTVPDERAQIATALRESAERADLILTTGGTGLGPRDVTPEATHDVLERELPGFGEAMRAASRAKTPFADLSRATAGSLGSALIVNLPGSPNGAVECLSAVLPAVRHAVKLLRGAVRDCQDPAAR